MGRINSKNAVSSTTTRSLPGTSYTKTPKMCWAIEKGTHIYGRFVTLKESDILINGGADVAIRIETMKLPIDKPRRAQDSNEPKIYNFYKSRDFAYGEVGKDKFFNYVSDWLESVADDEETQEAIYDLWGKNDQYFRKPDGKPYQLKDLLKHKIYAPFFQIEEQVVKEDGVVYSLPAEGVEGPYFFEISATLLNKITAQYEQAGWEDFWNEVESPDLIIGHTTKKRDEKYTVGARLKNPVTVFDDPSYFEDENKPSMVAWLDGDEFTEEMAIEAFKKAMGIGVTKTTASPRRARTSSVKRGDRVKRTVKAPVTTSDEDVSEDALDT